MSGLSFERAWALLLLALVPAWLWFERARAARAIGLLQHWLGERADRLAPARPQAAARAAAARRCGGMGLALLVVALAGPQWGEPEAATRGASADLVVCLDVSASMQARDLPPDRMRAARAAVASLLSACGGDRVALVLFAGEAALRVPRTTDLAALQQVADGASELDVARGGTDLGAALDVALLALVGAPRGAVFLFTDGEDPQGTGLAAALRCRQQGVAVHCVAIGGERGAKIPVATAQGEAYLRGPDGREVLSVPDRAALQAIADAAGGKLVEGVALDDVVALRRLHVAAEARQRLAEQGLLRRPAAFAPPLLLAVLLLLWRWRLLRSADTVHG